MPLKLQFLYLTFHSQQSKHSFLVWFSHYKTLCSALAVHTISEQKTWDRVQKKRRVKLDIQCHAGKKKDTISWKSKTFWSLVIGSTAGSIVVCSSHATLCDPVCLPELLSWKCGGATSVQEVAGVIELRGHKAEWLMIHRFKRHRMASGKLGATRKYTHTVAQSDNCKCILTHVDSALSG